MKQTPALAIAAALLLGVALTDMARSDTPRKSDTIVFEGTVLNVGPHPHIACGLLAIYQLATYKVERVWKGDVPLGEIVVEHLACSGKELEGIKQGDRVLVIVTRETKAPLETTTSVEGTREEKAKPAVFFYNAQRVGKLTNCCDKQ
jgi:hypothetical protein